MRGQECTAKEIINKLRKAEVLRSKGISIEEVMRQLRGERRNVLSQSDGFATSGGRSMGA